MYKIFLSVIFIMLVSSVNVSAVPPSPHTFVPNRGAIPSKILAMNMKQNISGGIRQAIIIWNKKYSDPTYQISDLLKLFKFLSDTPQVPIQMLKNKEFELFRVLDTERMLKYLEKFKEDTNSAYRSLFEYSSLVVGSKQGSMEDAYKDMLKKMRYMVNSYNRLAKEVNRQYKQKIMPYYALDYKKKRKSFL